VHVAQTRAESSFRIFVRARNRSQDVDPIDTYLAVLSSRSFATPSEGSRLLVARLGHGAVIRGTVSADSAERARRQCLRAVSSLPKSIPGHEARSKALTDRADALKKALEESENNEFNFSRNNNLYQPAATELTFARQRLARSYGNVALEQAVLSLVHLEIQERRLSQATNRARLAFEAAVTDLRDAEQPDYDVSVIDSCD
jgi:hypothetical protein